MSKNVSDKARCEAVLNDLIEGLAVVFGKEKIKVEIENTYGEPNIVIDGWVELVPVMAVPEPQEFIRFGKKHTVTYKGERPMWAVNIIEFIPGDRETPEDVDIREMGNFAFHDAIKKAINLISSNIYDQWAQAQAEARMDEIETEQILADYRGE
jgi:hypothetical protein